MLTVSSRADTLARSNRPYSVSFLNRRSWEGKLTIASLPVG
jgi:hypothetical protein